MLTRILSFYYVIFLSTCLFSCSPSSAVHLGYPSLSEVIDLMNSAATSHPDIAKVYDITTLYDMPATFEGRHMFAIKISDNVAVEEDEPDVVIFTNHHSRELGALVIGLEAIERFTTNYGSDSRVTDAVNKYEIWIAPTWNPDGYNHVYNVDINWRKNRRVFFGGTGVDLNRNYPPGWNNSCSGSTNLQSNTYKGPSAASESETQTMMAWANDQRFAKLVDYHNAGREALYGYVCDPQHPFDDWLRNEAIVFSSQSGYGGAVRKPSTDGQHPQWHLANGTYTLELETHTTRTPSYESALSEAETVWPGILWFIERPISLSGHVTDAVTGNAMEAELDFVGVNYQTGEINRSGGPFGRYHTVLPPGEYEIIFSADGYTPETKNVNITSSSEEILDVQLSPIDLPKQ